MSTRRGPRARNPACRAGVLLRRLAFRLLPLSFATLAAAASAPTGSSNLPLMQYGPLEFRPHFTYSGSYQDGLLSGPGQPRNSYIDTFAPGMRFNYGARWSFDYIPTLRLYSNPVFRDTLNHAATAEGGLSYAGTALRFRQNYTYDSSSLVETGRQTDTETVTSELTGTRVLNPKLTLQGGLQQRLAFVSGGRDFHTWGASGGIQSALSSRVIASVGVQAGYSLVYRSPDMAHVQPGVQLAWNPSPKLSLSGGMSADLRAIMAPRKWRWSENILYSGSARYSPFSTSTIEGQIGRSVTPSFFDGQTVDNTTAGVSGEQRFLGRFWVGGKTSYSYANYLTTGRTDAIKRQDHLWTYEASVRTTFLQRGSISVSYQETDVDSSVRGFGHKTTRIGCTVGYRY